MTGMAASQTASPRRVRERELVLATRALFDEKGMQDAPIEEIAKAVGIARGLIYRHFSSKEELFMLTVTDYLDELEGELVSAINPTSEPAIQLECCAEAFASYCQRYPAFLDSSLSLMRRPARELHGIVSESVWLRLGQGMSGCLAQLAQVLERGRAAGTFSVEDADYTANVMWTQMLGVMHLARIRIGVRQLAPGVPGIFPVAPEQIVRTCVASALATVGA